MKKMLFMLFVLVSAMVMGANYNSDTLGALNESNSGQVTVEYFSYATGTTAHTNDTIFLCRIPAQARILKGEISVSAMGGEQVFAMGFAGADGSGYYTGTTADDVDFLLNDIACSNAVVDTFADLAQGDAGACYELGNRPVYLTISTEAGKAAWTTNETIKGFVVYIEP